MEILVATKKSEVLWDCLIGIGKVFGGTVGAREKHSYFQYDSFILWEYGKVLGTARDAGLDVHFRSLGCQRGPKWHPSQVLGTKVHLMNKTEGFSAIVPFMNKLYKYGDVHANVYLHLALCILCFV